MAAAQLRGASDSTLALAALTPHAGSRGPGLQLLSRGQDNSTRQFMFTSINIWAYK